jgi:hypothetical protein
VARILHLTNVREARAEGRALDDLRGQAGHGCRDGAAATSFATFAGTRRASMVSWITPALGAGAGIATGAGSTSSPAAGSSPPGVKPSGSTVSPTPDLNNGVTRATAKTKSNHRSSQNNGVAVAINPSSSTSSLLPVLVAVLALTGVALLLWPLVQRRLRTTGGTDAASDPEPIPDADATNGLTPPASDSPAAVAVAPVGAAAPAAGAARSRTATSAGPAGAAPRAASAPSPVAAASAPRFGGHTGRGRRAAVLAVGSAAAMRRLRLARSRRRGK